MHTWLLACFLCLFFGVEGLQNTYFQNCHPDLPFMSVGDFNITKENFDR